MATEKSKPSKEIIDLGKQLVKEFSDHGRCDQTTAWMAHYLSEIIHEAESEKSIAKKRKLQIECCDIILDLWKKRSYYPGRHKPLAELSDAVNMLSALKKEDDDPFSWRQFRAYEDTSSWGQFIRHTRRTMEDTLALSLCTAVAEDVLKREKRWLKHENLLSENEKIIIKYLDTLIDKTYEHIRIIYGDEKKSKPEDRLTIAFNKLRSLAADHVKKTDDLRDKIIKKNPVAKKNGKAK